jgi:DegV family protein with EDD domain
MRIGLVVDSSCDLPAGFFQQNNVVILPITVKIGDAILADHRNEEATLQFLDAHIATRGAEAETMPFTVDQIRELFLKRLVIDYDYVFCITITKNRSPIFDNATQASFGILNDYRPIRSAAGHNTPFALRVIDSQNFFSAQGIPTLEAAAMIAAEESPPKIRARVEHVAQQTQGYMIPRDLHYMRARTRLKGDNSVSWLSATFGTALDIKPIILAHRGDTTPVAKVRGFEPAARKLFLHAADRVRGGLVTPHVAISYGGQLDEMRALPGYNSLRGVCADHNVNLHESVMSLTGMVNVGKGALVVGFATDAPPFKD